jgi:dihydropyrimidinase
MTILIKSGTIITAAETFVADLLVVGEKIASLGPGLPVPEDAQVIDAEGKLVMPGGVDVHTHFDLPMFGTVSSDDHYTGHKAAAFGGTTTVIDFVPQEDASLLENLAQWHEKTDPKAAVDFGFHMNISHFNRKVAEELPELAGEGVTSVKVFTAYNNRLRLQDADIFRVMRLAGQHGLLTMVHAENGDVIDILVSEALAARHTSPEWHARTRPAWGAVEAVLRSASLAAQAGAPLYMVHMNAAGEVDMLEFARHHGVQVMGETCPQYLFFTEENLRQPDGAKFVCSPPLRLLPDNQRLWQGLASGTLQVVATDHCPFFYRGDRPIIYEGEKIAIPGKELGKNDFTRIPNGLPGVGDRMPVLWTYGVRAGRMTPNQFVALCCTQPARIFGLYPRKGTLMPGADADIVIWDPSLALTYGVAHSQQRTDHNLYEGWELVGWPVKVFLRGQCIVDWNAPLAEQRWLGRKGMGQYLYRKPFNLVL